jgi:hypothetical protein
VTAEIEVRLLRWCLIAVHLRECNLSQHMPSCIEIRMYKSTKMLNCEYLIERAPTVVKKNTKLQLRVSGHQCVTLANVNVLINELDRNPNK